MTNEQRKKNCSTLNDLCSTVKDLDDRLVSEHTDRVNTELQLQLDFDSKVTQNANQLRNELSQEIEAVNINIKTEVNKAIASVVDEAPESFDTLKEAADWIQTHGAEAAAMQSAITTLENNLTQEALDRTAQLSSKQDQLSSIQLRHSNDFINISSNDIQTKQYFKIAETGYRASSFDTFQLMGFVSSVLGNNERNYIAVNFVDRNSDYHSISGVLQKPCKDWDIEVHKNEKGDSREIYFVTSNAWVSFNGYCVNYTNNGTIILNNLSTATTPTGTLIGKLSESTELQIMSYKVDKDLSNATGALPISNGGTGAITANGARNNLLSNVSVETSTPGDDSLFAMNYTNPSDTNGAVYTRKASLIWEYIKGKISTTLGLTSSNYGGTSAKATSDASGKNIANTYATKSVATTTQNGLMSSSDKSKLDTLVPVGTILGGVYSTAPTGYLLCNGSSFNKDTYPALYSVLGTNVLPDLRGKFLQGANGNLKQSIEAGLPNITGELEAQSYTDKYSATGAFSTVQRGHIDSGSSAASTYQRKVDFDARRSSRIYGNSDTVQPPAYTANYIIKY